MLSSSALVLRGILPDAGDVDIVVTEKGLEELKQNYDLHYKERDWFDITDKIEGVCVKTDNRMRYKPDIIGDYYVQNINEYLEFLEKSKREKDKLRIPLVKEYIKKTNEGKI